MGYESEVGPQFISSGGNLFALTMGEPVHMGPATRGRGHWVGAATKDEENPDVDNPSPEGAQRLIVKVGDKDDGFDDSGNPWDYGGERSRREYVKQANRAAKQAEGLGTMVTGNFPNKERGGYTYKTKSLPDPADLDEQSLMKAVAFVEDLYKAGVVNESLREYAGLVAQATQDVLDSKRILRRAILTKPSEEREAPVKEAPKGPKKAQETKADAKGKTQYKYPKKNDGKRPGEPQTPPESPEEEAPDEEVSEAPKVDSEPFSKLVGVSPDKLKKLAEKKTKQAFVNFFMRIRGLDKHHIGPPYLGALYDSLVGPKESSGVAKSVALVLAVRLQPRYKR